MHQLMGLIHYVRDNPLIALVAAVAVVGLYRLLNRKSKLSREAEKRLEQLRDERGDVYKKLRPLR